MKTESLKSIAALFATALTLNLSALAGPGPHIDLVPRTPDAPKTTVALYRPQAEVKAVQETVKPNPSVIQHPGAHGGTTFTYSW